jgi:hypothetical protein
MMLDIAKNVRTFADAPHSGYQAYGVIRFNHGAASRSGLGCLAY